MIPMKPDIPGAKVYSSLYQPIDPEDLNQDVLSVELCNGFCIDVGWWPEYDPTGRYVIRVFYQSWDVQCLEPPIEVKTADRVIAEVERLAKNYSNVYLLPSGASGAPPSQAEDSVVRVTPAAPWPLPHLDVSQPAYVACS